MHKELAFLFTCFAVLTACTKSVYLKKINGFLNAHSAEAKSRYMAEDYHGFFAERKGGGKDKATALRSFMNWDGPLEPDIKILSYTKRDSVWTVVFNEQNDFTKPIGFPGWKGATIVTFDKRGLIKETLYLPDDSNPPYRPYLQPALDWLTKNKPAELTEVFKDNKLVQTEATANKWKALLQIWKMQTSAR